MKFIRISMLVLGLATSAFTEDAVDQSVAAESSALLADDG